MVPIGGAEPQFSNAASQSLVQVLRQGGHVVLVRHMSTDSVVICAAAAPHELGWRQTALGAERAAMLVGSTFRAVARAVADKGVRPFVVAGGGTSGTVVDALGIRALVMDPEIEAKRAMDARGKRQTGVVDAQDRQLRQ
jgi:uncharacterized protein YgbK (DUF1537 family)